MTEAITTREVQAETLERVLLGGDLSKLSAAERVNYYRAVCESVGLNPLTRPFEYLSLNGKTVLYAKRECTEQLRKIHGVSIGKLEKTFSPNSDLYIVEAPATDRTGRTDTSTGAVNIKGASGEQLANLLMKCETKAKRRVTLSICGLGMLDETEVDSIPGARVVQMPEDVDKLGDAFGVDDVPAVDIHEDTGIPLDLGEMAEEGSIHEVDGLYKKQAKAPPKPKITPENQKFCTEMKKQKLRIGAKAYYEVMGGAGFSHSWEVLDRKVQTAIWNTMKAIPDGGMA